MTLRSVLPFLELFIAFAVKDLGSWILKTIILANSESSNISVFLNVLRNNKFL